MIKSIGFGFTIFLFHSYAFSIHLPVYPLENKPQQIFSELQKRHASGKELEPRVINEARERHFFFVQGYLNELATYYFGTLVSSLKEHDVPFSQIDNIAPTSSYSVQENTLFIAKKIRLAFIRTHKPLIIIAHSKGALEVLLTLMSYPDLLELIDRVVFIQGSFYGSPIADLLSSYEYYKEDTKDVPMDGLWKLRMLRSGFSYVTYPFKNGLNSMSYRKLKTTNYRSILKEKFKDTWPRKKFYFVTGQTTESRTAHLFKYPSRFLKTKHGPNDGLVLIQDQSIKEVGSVIFNSQYDHVDLVLSRPISRNSSWHRQVFFKSLLTFLSNK